MKQSMQDLTQGPIALQILRFSIPLMFSNILQILFNIADVAVAEIIYFAVCYRKQLRLLNLQCE